MRNFYGLVFCLWLSVYMGLSGLISLRQAAVFTIWHPYLALGLAAAAGVLVFGVRGSEEPCRACAYKEVELEKLRDALAELK